MSPKVEQALLSPGRSSCEFIMQSSNSVNTDENGVQSVTKKEMSGRRRSQKVVARSVRRRKEPKEKREKKKKRETSRRRTRRSGTATVSAGLLRLLTHQLY